MKLNVLSQLMSSSSDAVSLSCHDGLVTNVLLTEDSWSLRPCVCVEQQRCFSPPASVTPDSKIQIPSGKWDSCRGSRLRVSVCDCRRMRMSAEGPRDRAERRLSPVHLPEVAWGQTSCLLPPSPCSRLSEGRVHKTRLWKSSNTIWNQKSTSDYQLNDPVVIFSVLHLQFYFRTREKLHRIQSRVT